MFSDGLLHMDESVLADQQKLTNKHQLCVDTVCSLENQPGMMDDRDRWWERKREREKERESHRTMSY